MKVKKTITSISDNIFSIYGEIIPEALWNIQRLLDGLRVYKFK